MPIKPKAFAVLHYLLERPGQLITRADLLARFWPDVHVGEGVLKTQIGEIRHALGERATNPRFIETVHSRGYRFVGRIEDTTPVAAEPLPPSQGSGAPPALDVRHMVRRPPDIDFLKACWLRARSGERQLVFVTGEAGIGKTVLVQQFLREALLEESNVWITWGQCVDQSGAGEPYLPIFEALRRPCSEPGGERIVECLLRSAPAWLAQMPTPATALGTAADPTSPDPAVGLPAARMLGQAAQMFEALSAQAPVVLLVEDLHWADDSTLELLAYLAQRSDPARLLVIGTYRPVEAAARRVASVEHLLRARRRCSTLSVLPWSQAAVAEYLDKRFARHRLPPALAALLYRRTEGNALFVTGIVDDWLARGMLAEPAGRCELVSELDELARSVPDSFVRELDRALALCNPLERSILEAASVAGTAFSTATVAAVLSIETEQVEELCLRWARRGRFFKSVENADGRDGAAAEVCEFLHVVHQQAILERIGAARRARLRQRLEERTEERIAPRDAERATPLLRSTLHLQESPGDSRSILASRRASDPLQPETLTNH